MSVDPLLWTQQGELTASDGAAGDLFGRLAVAISGVLVWRGDRNGARLYGAMLIGTLAWSLLDAGLAGWALMPRLAVPFAIGYEHVLARGPRGVLKKPAPPR